MSKRREKKLEGSITDCLETINNAKLSREELVVVLGQLLIRSGYSVYWGYENPGTERPDKVTKEIAEDLYISTPSTGSTLMKIGFDLQDVLLLRK